MFAFHNTDIPKLKHEFKKVKTIEKKRRSLSDMRLPYTQDDVAGRHRKRMNI